MLNGTVKWFSEQKGYGFIAGDDGQDVFVHRKNILVPEYRRLDSDQRVEYEKAKFHDRETAVNVSVIE